MLSLLSDFTVQYVKENGLEAPLLFKDSLSSLGMKYFLVVFQNFFWLDFNVVFKISCFLKKKSPQERRKDLLNLLSLEFSLTPLANIIQAPSVAREIDWVELFWPKKSRTSSVSYPKVQNYCLMSVKRSFTDFHIDFGGTSVWYHVYKGRKIFWLVEPTEENIVKYEKWILEGSQREAFYGDLVNRCTRVELYEGNTFIIPSGWIHAVYTPEDSLVFGGNFLHSFSIPMQIRINRSENTLMIKRKYRYPRYSEMLWFVIEGIVNKADGLVQETAKNEVIFIFGAQRCDLLNIFLFFKYKNSIFLCKIRSLFLLVTESSPQVVRPRPPKYKLRASKKQDHHKPDGPLIVGGIPPAIMPPDAPLAPNPYDYDPLASVTPLGHKQLPSAYRRTPDVKLQYRSPLIRPGQSNNETNGLAFHYCIRGCICNILNYKYFVLF
ncbi:unnamed protein product [Thelazia callipaeda]|uniref:JmjC domain-containing protein n=1 Tax=Thelazia callipaeda TaxID=103827 RepID=A0A0N5CYP1_THECL|nr:unnamed protein product [Thelazia callipaeda]